MVITFPSWVLVFDIFERRTSGYISWKVSESLQWIDISRKDQHLSDFRSLYQISDILLTKSSSNNCINVRFCFCWGDIRLW